MVLHGCNHRKTSSGTWWIPNTTGTYYSGHSVSIMTLRAHSRLLPPPPRAQSQLLHDAPSSVTHEQGILNTDTTKTNGCSRHTIAT